jgi:hypothetical protein
MTSTAIQPDDYKHKNQGVTENVTPFFMLIIVWLNSG